MPEAHSRNPGVGIGGNRRERDLTLCLGKAHGEHRMFTDLTRFEDRVYDQVTALAILKKDKVTTKNLMPPDNTAAPNDTDPPLC